MAKKFFFVCAGLLMLTAAGFLASRAVVPAHAASQFPTPTEVATLSGILPHGAIIPLPVYADGTAATEGECVWLVSIESLMLPTTPFFCYASASAGGDALIRGRVVSCYAGGVGNATGNVNYLIIATRPAHGATTAQQQSWGALKANYR
jgi:hypothetical protein